MPPKKAKGKGKGKKEGKKPKKPAEPEPPPELSEEVKALIRQVEQLQQDVEREMKERNKFQLEVDMLRTFWEVTGQQLEETNAHYVNLYNEVETDELDHRQDIKEYLGEIKLYKEDLKKHRKDFDEHVRTPADAEVKPYEKERGEMILDEQLDMEDAVNAMKAKHNENRARRQQDMQEQLLRTRRKYTDKLELLQHDLTNKEKTKLSEREYYWSSLIHNLQQDHDRRYSDFDASLDQCKKKDLRHKDKLRKQIQVFVATEENKNQRVDGALDVKMLKLEQKKVQAQIIKLRNHLRNPIMRTHPNENVRRAELARLKGDYDLRRDEFERLEQLMDDMRRKFPEDILDIQRKADHKHARLEAQLASATETIHELRSSVCSRLFGFELPDAEAEAKAAAGGQDHWSRKTRLNQTLGWQLKSVKELLHRDMDTAVKERTALVQLINEKTDELSQAQAELHEVSRQLRAENAAAPEPPPPPLAHLRDERQPLGGLMDEVVRIACKEPPGGERHRLSALMLDPLLERQLRNSKELLQSHAQVATKRRTQLILALNDKTQQLHALQRKVKEARKELDKQKMDADRKLGVQGALLQRTQR